jgi:hypothetical protein
MPAAISTVIARLDAFVATDCEADNMAELNAILEPFFRGMRGRQRALDALFRVLERSRNKLLGAPGPVVHAIEKIPGYEPRLQKSLKRIPTDLGIWMANRILNVLEEPADRAPWTALLETIAARDDLRPDLRDAARQFGEFQASGGVRQATRSKVKRTRRKVQRRRS